MEVVGILGIADKVCLLYDYYCIMYIHWLVAWLSGQRFLG